MGRARVRSDGPRDGVARHRHARIAARGVAVHRDDRAAAGAEDRLSGGDRVPDAATSTPRSCDKLGSAMAKNGYGHYLLAHAATSRTAVDARRRDAAIPDVLLIEPQVFGDARGFFFESWNARAFAAAGIDADVRAGQPLALAPRRAARAALSDRARAGQARARRRRRSVRRRRRPAAKRRRPSGAACRRRAVGRRTGGCCSSRPDSRTASSSCPTTAEFLYKTTDYWYPEHERTLLWNDPALGIDWPQGVVPALAAKDAAGVPLASADCYR